VHVQVKIWFQNHRYKTKKALKDQNHAEQRTTADAPDLVDRTPSPTTLAMPLVVKDEKKCSTEDDDWTRGLSTVDDRSSEWQQAALQSPGVGFRSSGLRPGDGLGYHPTSMYVGGSQTAASPPPMFLPTSTTRSMQLAVDQYRARLQWAVAARPGSRSQVDSSPPAFAADAGLASVLYGPRDAAAAPGTPMACHYPSYGAATNSTSWSIDKPIASPLGYLSMSSLRSW